MLNYVKIRKIPCPLALDYTNESSSLQGDKFSPKMATTTIQPSEFRNFFFISNKINSISDQSAVDFGQPKT